MEGFFFPLFLSGFFSAWRGEGVSRAALESSSGSSSASQGDKGRRGGEPGPRRRRGDRKERKRERDGGMRSGGGDRVGDDMAKSSLSEAQGASVASTFHQEPS